MIRKAKKSDLDSIVELESLFKSPFSEKDVLYELKTNPVSSIFVYCEDGVLIGFIDVWVTFDSSSIAQIAVNSKYQRKGIATELLNYCFEFLKKKKVVFCTLEVRENNISAINLYQKVGFEKVCLKPAYYSNGENAIYMMKGIF